MLKEDAQEGAGIVQRMLVELMKQCATRGRTGADLRRDCGDVIANAERLLYLDEAGPPLDKCFESSRLAGITIPQLRHVRNTLYAETPFLLGAVLVTNSGIQLCLATQSRILADTHFTSRDDVEKLKERIIEGFAPAEENAADDMDQMTYRALVELHAAVTFYMVETARPLPRMVRFRFAQNLPSVYLSYRLYDTAARADELRAENKIVHPAFMQIGGRALSA
jgi:hypothetical protein